MEWNLAECSSDSDFAENPEYTKLKKKVEEKKKKKEREHRRKKEKEGKGKGKEKKGKHQQNEKSKVNRTVVVDDVGGYVDNSVVGSDGGGGVVWFTLYRYKKVNIL